MDLFSGKEKKAPRDNSKPEWKSKWKFWKSGKAKAEKDQAPPSYHESISGNTATNKATKVEPTNGTIRQHNDRDQRALFNNPKGIEAQPAPPLMPTAMLDFIVMPGPVSNTASSSSDNKEAQNTTIECSVDASQNTQTGPEISFICKTSTVRSNAAEPAITTVKRTLTFEEAQNIVEVSKKIWDDAFALLDEDEKKILQLEKEAASVQASITFDGLVRSVKEKKATAAKKWGSMLTYEWRGRKFNLTKLMDNVITWLDRFKQIGDIVVQYDTAHMALPWAATRFLLQILIENKDNMAAITLTLERVTNVTALSAIYMGMYFDEKNLSDTCRIVLKKCLVNLHQHVLSFLSSCIRYLKGKPMASLFRNESFEERLTDIDKFMMELKQAVDTADKEVERLHNLSNKDKFDGLKSLLEGLGTQLEALQRTTEALGRDIEDQKRRDLLAWVSDCQYEAHHATAGNRILANTGQWLFKHSEFMDWESSDKYRVFWLTGEPGVGKTYLTHAAIKRSAEKPVGPTVYFYCSRSSQQDDSRRNPSALLRSLLKALLIHTAIDPQTIDWVHYDSNQTINLVERHNSKNEMGLLSLDESKSALISILHQQSCYRAMIFIDALDEVDENDRVDLITAISDIVRGTTAQLWLSSRPNYRIHTQVMHAQWISDDDEASWPGGAGEFEAVRTLSVDKQNTAEINEFIEREVEDSLKRGRLSLYGVHDKVELKNRIVLKLVEKAGGMFLWARLQILQLCKARYLEHLYKQLDSLPQDLMATYAIIYKTIVTEEIPEVREDALNALGWLMCARKPLTAAEWVDLVALGRDTCLPKEDQHEYLRQICNNLVTIDQRKEVRLIHLSVKEFLETQSEFLDIDPDEMAAGRCLACLTGGSLQTTIPAYAYQFWPIHCREALSRLSASAIPAHSPRREEIPLPNCPSRMTELVALQRKFFQSQAAHKLWLEHLKETEISPDLDPLFTTARYGLIEILEEISQSPQKFHIKETALNRTRSNPLHIAIRFKQQAAVETILRCAKTLLDVNARDQEGRTPFALAVLLKHSEIVRTLLTCWEVDVNEADDIGEYPPLVRAVWQENEEMVRILLDEPAPDRLNINTCDVTGRTALHWAVRRGNTAIVKRLLAADVDVNARDKITQSTAVLDLISILTKFWWTKLKGSGDYEVNQGGHKVSPEQGLAILQELCNHPRVDVNRPAPFQNISALGMLALTLCNNASQEEFVAKVCRILMSAKNIDLNARGLWTSTILQIIAHGGFKNRRLARLLLEDKRIDINAVAGPTLGSETVLHFAVKRGSLEFVELLLSFPGINTRIRDLWGDTPLMNAIAQVKQLDERLLAYDHDRVQIARLLLVFEKVSIGEPTLKNLVDGHSSIYADFGDNGHEPEDSGKLSDAVLACQRVAEVFRAAAEMDDDKDVAKEKLSHLDVNVVDDTGNNALQLACCIYGSFFLSSMYFINGKGKRVPSREQCDRVIANLLDTPSLRVDNNQHDDVGLNVISSAGHAHYSYAIRRLRDVEGIDLNSPMGYGTWSLLAAFTSGLRTCKYDCSVVTAIVEDERVDVNAPLPWGELPINFALKELDKHGNDPHSFAQCLLDTGRVDLNAKDFSTGKTPLGTAVLTGIPKAVHLILDHKAFKAENLDTPDHDWNTPLGLAIGAEKQNEEIILRLLKKGANLSWRNYRGETPLEIAINRKNGNPRVVELVNNEMK